MKDQSNDDSRDRFGWWEEVFVSSSSRFEQRNARNSRFFVDVIFSSHFPSFSKALLHDRPAAGWFYSNQITDGQAIHSQILFDSSRSSCDLCLSFPFNVFCGLRLTSERSNGRMKVERKRKQCLAVVSAARRWTNVRQNCGKKRPIDVHKSFQPSR